VSNVDTANKLIFASASGAARAASTPISDKTKGPCTLRTCQSGWDFTPAGTRESSVTIESSSPVRVTEKKEPFVAQEGMGESGPSREMAKRPGSKLISRWRVAAAIER
jgi:hypothetical protein